jgi:hypothetical protein
MFSEAGSGAVRGLVDIALAGMEGVSLPRRHMVDWDMSHWIGLFHQGRELFCAPVFCCIRLHSQVLF